MTREEILAMPAGRELDALVAKKVMGTELQWDEEERQSYRLADSPFGEILNPFNPSTDISAAWEVFNALKDRGYLNAIKNLVGGKYEASFLDWGGKCTTYSCISDTAPEAICKAALIAVMEGQANDL